MSAKTASQSTAGPLDELTAQLLECGAVLSQMVSHMVKTEARGRSVPDAAPIPEIAQSLIRSVIGGVARRHTAKEIKVAAEIVAEVTDAICEDIFLYDFGDEET